MLQVSHHLEENIVPYCPRTASIPAPGLTRFGTQKKQRNEVNKLKLVNNMVLSNLNTRSEREQHSEARNRENSN